MATLAATRAAVGAEIEPVPAAGFANAANLSTAQTGNGASTNVVDRGGLVGPALIVLTTAIGATPTCTYAIQGSADGVNWYSVQYADSATPATVVATTFVITTAVTAMKIVQPNQPVRFLRLNYSANTNVTNTADVYVT